jgi:hypothetical protein
MSRCVNSSSVRAVSQVRVTACPSSRARQLARVSRSEFSRLPSDRKRITDPYRHSVHSSARKTRTIWEPSQALKLENP